MKYMEGAVMCPTLSHSAAVYAGSFANARVGTLEAYCLVLH